MADRNPTIGMTTRRQMLLAAPWLGISAMLPGRARGQQSPDGLHQTEQLIGRLDDNQRSRVVDKMIVKRTELYRVRA